MIQRHALREGVISKKNEQFRSEYINFASFYLPPGSMIAPDKHD